MSAASGRGARAVLALGVALDLGILGYFKYLDFFIAQSLTLAHSLGFDLPLGFVNVTLPVAISFLTFHAISYIVDVYRGRLKASRSPLDILLYISFFPHLVAGPIVRAHEFLPQLASPRRAEDFGFGENMLLILGGLLKKMVIANYLAVQFVDPVFTDPTQFSRFDLVMAVYAYAIQIYADFSAYTDIAIGVAALLGYRFPQNFNQPYRALGIGDFWRRWHMTLVELAARLSLHPARRQSRRPADDGAQSDADHAARRALARRQLDVPDLGRAAWRGAGRRSRLPPQRASYARSAPTPWAVGDRLGGDVPFRLLLLAVLPRALARRGDAISRRHLDRQRRRLDHAGDRLAAAGRGRVHAVHPAGLARAGSASGSTRAAFRRRCAFGAAAMYLIVVMAPDASAPFIYFQF